MHVFSLNLQFKLSSFRYIQSSQLAVATFISDLGQEKLHELIVNIVKNHLTFTLVVLKCLTEANHRSQIRNQKTIS